MRSIKRCVILMIVLCLIQTSALAYYDNFVVRNGDRSKKQVAITMDDCFNIQNVQKMMDICQKYQIPVTFFLLGTAMHEEDADIWREIARSPLAEIGNHTWHHANLAQSSRSKIITELMKNQELLDALLGFHYPMQVMRPPYGSITVDGNWGYVANSIYKVKCLLKIVLWDVSETNPDKAIRKVKNGSILLYHANGKDLRCLEQIIPQLLEEGYTFCTISQMFDLPPIEISDDLYVFHSSDY